MNKINQTDFFEAIAVLARANQLEVKEIDEILTMAVIKSFHSKFDPDAELEVIIDRDKGMFSLINNTKYVVEDEEGGVDPSIRPIEIGLKDAQKINPDVKEGDVVSEEVDFDSYSRTVAQQVKQLIIQKVREKRKEVTYSKHKSLVGEMIDVRVESVSKSFAIFRLEDMTAAFMPFKFMSPNTKYAIGQMVKVYVEEVLEESKDAQIIVSNSSKAIVKRVLEMEVPEIHDGVIEIMSMARIAGSRTKVALKSNDENVDPVGSVIGAGGERITRIVEKLNGEKLDIIRYSSEKIEYIANAISPARVISVMPKEEQNDRDKYIIIVPNSQKTLAIGRFGSNAKLAAELVSIGVDVISQQNAEDQNISFEWNGNITPEEVIRIDSGEKLNKWGKKSEPDNYRPARSSRNLPTFNMDEFESDVLEFNEDITINVPSPIVTKKTNSEVKVSKVKVEDPIFTDAELKEMESQFALNDDLTDFSEFDAEFDLDSLKDEEK